MEKYIVLLRGINVGKNHLLAMADLKISLEELGYQQIQTYIRSGNVVMIGPQRASEEVAQQLTAKLSQDAGFSIPAIVYTKKEFLSLFNENPLLKKDTLSPSQELIVAFQQNEIEDSAGFSLASPAEEGLAFKQAVFIKINGSQLSSELLKSYQKLFKQGNWTIRNWKTTSKLLELIHNLK